MTETKALPTTRRWRIAALIVFTILLHVLAIHWGQSSFNAAKTDDKAPSDMNVTLVQLEQPKQPVSLPVAAKQKPPRPRPTPTPTAKAPPPTEGPANPVVETSSVLAPDAQPGPTSGEATAAAVPAADASAPAPTADNTATKTEQGTQYQFDPPPSADLEYDVHAFFDNLDWHGTSTQTWKAGNNRYSVDGEVYVRMFAKITFLTYTSQGDLNEFGVSPEIYTEKKRNRPATNTHFNRERNLVSFSSSTTTYPRVGGEQDRASIIWQLAAIGRGDAAKFTPGAVVDMFVAGVRDGEVWRMQIVGKEDIRLYDGSHQAWHVVRQPRPGSYDQRLDIWLTPDKQWYPARLRFTETNGDYLEMSLSNLKTR
ncbi:hypothetical protein hmeg3_03220 [Herbaspirillum sp. meg3]|uniref:DUF3108 domain-containing protein n=1 Tax=Herbaspirillum sp. meg3 TaxID=2025949 RepID=UPI000B98597C|nr:DUF3108 domain-containing protein [Herbaspirillum sp. meg3]ASU37402.1 hypothetical protein hmeg3_03220 [Herbaspirillum sp. meg3]